MLGIFTDYNIAFYVILYIKKKNTKEVYYEKILSYSEADFIKKYRQLDTDGKSLIAAIIDKRIAQLKLQSKNTA